MDLAKARELKTKYFPAVWVAVVVGAILIFASLMGTTAPWQDLLAWVGFALLVASGKKPGKTS